ncbi:MAG: DUF6680 family protein [Ignavibacteriota bacterium]
MEVLMIIAIIAGPILAIQIQKYIEDYKEKKSRKLKIFKTLMATRASRINFQHVEALNMIDLEFSENKKKEKEILVAWKIYLDHLNSFPLIEVNDFEIRRNNWFENGDNLFTKLLHSLSKYFGYEFDEVHLKKGIYAPQGHSELELDQIVVRKGLVNLFEKKYALPITIVEAFKNEENTEVKRI